MPLLHFRQPPRVTAHVASVPMPGAYPERLGALFPRELSDSAVEEVRHWPGYAPTPLRSLDRLAAALGIGAVHYKDEAERFGLGSFKALGGAYGVIRVLSDRLGIPTAEIRAGRGGERVRAFTVTCATDGNHGTAVAWGAQLAGCQCRIWLPAQVSAAREEAIRALGAEVVRVDAGYDEAVRICAEESVRHGWQMVSDTSWEGYLQVPRLVMAGYTLIVREVLDALDEPPSHVFVQSGVGGLAAALAARFWMELGEARPRLVIVESEYAACLLASARRGRPTPVRVRHETLMGGLSCGTPSVIAWEILRRSASHFITIPDSPIAPTLRMLASGAAGGEPILAGETAAAGPLALIAVACNPRLREAMALDADSRVLLFGTEGIIDPEAWRALTGVSP